MRVCVRSMFVSIRGIFSPSIQWWRGNKLQLYCSFMGIFMFDLHASARLYDQADTHTRVCAYVTIAVCLNPRIGKCTFTLLPTIRRQCSLSTRHGLHQYYVSTCAQMFRDIHRYASSTKHIEWFLYTWLMTIASNGALPGGNEAMHVVAVTRKEKIIVAIAVVVPVVYV